MSDIRIENLFTDFYEEREGPYTVKYIPPTNCPVCGTMFSALKYKHILKSNEDSTGKLYCFAVCPNCERGIVAEYSTGFDEDYSCGKITNFNKFDRLEPVSPNKHSFDPILEGISPNFVKIYNEAFAAEKYELKEICGMGYRKALEFLVKDYLCHAFPTQSDSIKEDSLSGCINNKSYGFTDMVKSVAERCAWLGNDHSHYIFRHTDCDLDDLKKLLNMTVSWITLLLQSEDAKKIERK